MSKFKDITIGDFVWLAIEFNGKIMPLYIRGRRGDCIGP